MKTKTPEEIDRQIFQAYAGQADVMLEEVKEMMEYHAWPEEKEADDHG